MNRKNHSLRNTIFYIILSIFALLQIFPFYLKLVESLQPSNFTPELGKIYWLPQGFHFENYIEAWRRSNMLTGYLNSIIYVTVYTTVSGFLAILVGYVIAKKKFRGRKLVYILLISTMMVPGEVLMIPNYLTIRDMHLLDNLAALIIPGLVNTFGIFLAKQFMYTIPDSVIEAARIDGASEFKIFNRIVLPMCSSVYATYFILTFTGMWNEYLWPMITMKKASHYTVQLCVNTFQTYFNTPYEQILMSASLVSALLPVVIVFLIFQKKFVEGMSLSGIK